MPDSQKVGFGGGCHWCTEAVFQAIKGVTKVEQGFITSMDADSAFSEAVIVHFDSEVVSLRTLIHVHLHTHKSTVNHSMRSKYRSGIYTFSEEQKELCEALIRDFQSDFNNRLVTKVYPFKAFKPSREALQNYYRNNPKKPFCEKYIIPKIEILQKKFAPSLKKIKFL